MRKVLETIAYVILGLIALKIIWALIKLAFGALGIAFSVVFGLIALIPALLVFGVTGYGLYRLGRYITRTALK